MSKVLPILFNKDMVRAILDGRKTVTRRVIKPQPEKDMIYKLGYCIDGSRQDIGKFGFGTHECGGKILYVKPLCTHGDLLYVRETWTRKDRKYYYRADFDSDYLEPCETLSGGYPAYCRNYPGCNGCAVGKQRIIWSPSIHMPKEAARIWLKVMDVRVEQLQEMTEEDAFEEGYEGICPYEHRVRCGDYESMCYVEGDCENPLRLCDKSVPEGFGIEIWNKTIKKSDLDRYGWDANPWVWVIEFEQCEKPAPCILAGMHPAEIQEGQYEDGCTPKQNCMGYGDAWTDETCEMCKNCQKYTGNEELKED